jgi:hypothetical protein
VTTDSYRAISKALEEKQTEFHTDKPKEEHSYRAVLKNMCYPIPLADIKTEIEKLGHQVIIVDAPWYVLNNHIRRDLQMTSVKKEICRSSNQYYTRLTTHPNDQILTQATGVCEDTCQTICLTDF